MKEVFYVIVIFLIFFLGWVLGRNEYINKKIIPKEKKTLEELEEELKSSVDDEDFESAVKIKKEIDKLKKVK